jgi:hypothetical protein
VELLGSSWHTDSWHILFCSVTQRTQTSVGVFRLGSSCGGHHLLRDINTVPVWTVLKNILTLYQSERCLKTIIRATYDQRHKVARSRDHCCRAKVRVHSIYVVLVAASIKVQLYSFLDLGARRGWAVSVTPRPLSTPEKDPVPIVQEALCRCSCQQY